MSLGLTAVVFTVDLMLPLGVAAAVPYTFAVLIALSARDRWFGPAMAGLCGVLTIAKLGLAPDRGTTELWKVIANRCLAVFAITTTAVLGVRRRRAEERLQAHQTELTKVGRLALLGQTAAALAHELNQPLAAIALQAEVAVRLAAAVPPRPDELSRAATETAEQARRAGEIVAAIRRLARTTAPGVNAVDLNDVARSAARQVEWQARQVGAEILVVTPPGRPPVAAGDRVQLELVTVNLIQNAVEAVASGANRRLVTVETAAAGTDVVVRVTDTGPGVSDPDGAFDWFVTAKPGGTGLGLAISRSIVESHGGRLTYSPAAGGGAAFTATLPAGADE